MRSPQAFHILTWYRESGIDEALACDPVNKYGVKAPQVQATALPALAEKPLELEGITSLEDLRATLDTFDGCALKKTATNTVFADGNPQSSLMLIGEAPGFEEDKQGKPFVGVSGKLLDKMFQSIGYDRTSLYISNILFWRPPQNRQPTTEEIETCLPFIKKHIDLVRPKVLVFVGGVAAKSLLGTRDGIMKTRGRWVDYTLEDGCKIPAMPIFHPAFLLRSPAQKKFAWRDLLQIQQKLKELDHA